MKRPIRATLSTHDVGRGMIVAQQMGPFHKALFDWTFEQAQRASEPGLATLDDFDLLQGLVWPSHLKNGRPKEPTESQFEIFVSARKG